MSDTAQAAMVPYPGGVVRRVWVKTGPQTGPMKVTVIGLIRADKSTADPGCCWYRGESQVFTPAADSITEVPVNLPVRHELNALTNAWDFDWLGLTMLDSSVPVPAHHTGQIPSGYGLASGALYPAMDAAAPERLQGDDRFPLPEYNVLLRAEIELGAKEGDGAAPVDDGGGLPPGEAEDDGGAGAVPAGAAAVAKAKQRNDAVRAALTCSAGGPCTGVARLLAKAGAAKSALRRRAVVLGKKRYSLSAGERKALTIRLSKKGKRYLKSHRRTAARLVLASSTGEKVSRRVVLHR